MTSQRILLPLDIRKWPVEVFSVVNNLAKDPGVAVTLLHVVMLNLSAPEKRVYEAVGRDAQWHLGHLARGCLRPGVTAHMRVRFGKPAEEILAEAVDGNADLIVMATQPPSFWKRLFARFVPPVVERVVREAACGVYLTTASKHFDSEKLWGRPLNAFTAASCSRAGALAIEPARAPLPEGVFAAKEERHRAAA